MSLLQTWNDYLTGSLTTEQVAEILKVTPQTVLRRANQDKAKTLLTLSVLDEIARDNMDRSDAAAALGVAERMVNVLMLKWGVSRPIKPYILEMEYARTKWAIRKKAATDFIGLKCSDIEQAAEAAGVSSRQIRRWVAEMLAKHEGIQYKDLMKLGVASRSRLAAKILQAEDLEEAKQKMINDIALGKLTINQIVVRNLSDAKKTRTMTALVRPNEVAKKRRARNSPPKDPK